jgi:hypothetical protein
MARHMLLQQPPALELGICYFHSKFKTTGLVKYCDGHGGLRMDPLYDWVQEWLGTPRHFW